MTQYKYFTVAHKLLQGPISETHTPPGCIMWFHVTSLNLLTIDIDVESFSINFGT